MLRLARIPYRFAGISGRLILVALLLPIAAAAQDDVSEDVWEDDWEDSGDATGWHGFVEAGLGSRLQTDARLPQRNTLEELRWRIESDRTLGRAIVALKADAGFDGIESRGYVDIRDATLSFTAGEAVDIKLGHQVQTWGTGDLVFLNDLFPKDFVSFFAGRDDEYLKAPGSAIRLTRFGSVFGIDFVWTPVFEPDVYLTGERFSFFSPLAGENVAPRPPISAIEPDRTFANGEFAVRAFRTVEGREYALYGYRGFFKQPSALNRSLLPTFAPLSAWGASLRKPAGRGLLNAEFAYYDSRDDRDGADPLIPNSQLRLLAGYEWEAARNFTVGLQYSAEWTLDHDELLAGSLAPQFEPEEYRQILTSRFTYRSGRERYLWSLFTFLSPTDKDFYLRPQFTLRYSDEWTYVFGGSLFGGDGGHTFFAQFEDASNVYLRARYNY
jgi:hypothetical protein